MLALMLGAIALSVHAASPADAAERAPATVESVASQSDEESPGAQASDDDDDLVEVQLLVLGLAILVVVIGGSAAYLLRKRLGLVAGPPDQDASAHH